MKPISVLLVDDNPKFLRFATRFLEAHNDVVVVGTATRCDEAITQAEDLRPQVMLLDLAVPDLASSLEAIPRLRKMLPEMGIIAVTMFDTGGYRQAALKAGADDFIPKRTIDTDLLPAIWRVGQADRAGEEMVASTPCNQEMGSAAVRRILVMEDDDHLRRLYSKALSRSGYDVYPAPTIEEARGLLTSSQFDIFLCDIQMGNGLGTDLVREQRAMLRNNGTQVIMVSGEARYRTTCEEMGVDFYLEKPVPVSMLLTLVERLTARR
ncbi:MAG: response regulator [Candidatus Thorarchaeota archaeon]